MNKIITHSDEETQDFGAKLASKTAGGDILCLYGELGAGKTTFSKGFAEGLGISDRIISPTFVVIREHDVNSETVEKLYHIDLYRLEDKDQIKDLGLKEIIQNPKNVVIIEWAEKLGDLLPKKRLDIHFKQLTAEEREITIQQHE